KAKIGSSEAARGRAHSAIHRDFEVFAQMAGHPFVQYNAGLGRVGGVIGETVETNRGQCWGAGVVLVAVLVANCGGQSESKGSHTTDDGKWGGLPIPASCTPIY